MIVPRPMFFVSGIGPKWIAWMASCSGLGRVGDERFRQEYCSGGRIPVSGIFFYPNWIVLGFMWSSSDGFGSGGLVPNFIPD